MYRHIRQIHFVGIGGIGMSGIAEILLNMGYRVTGSDQARSLVTDRLSRLGIPVRIGHRPSHVGKAQVVVTSSAIPKTNPEIHEAIRRGIPVIARAEMLAELMRLKYGIAIAGSHGKTTTTSLIGSVLAAGGLDPTMVVGGRVKGIRSNARLGKGEFLVAEADESDGSFLHLSPTIAVVTNIDREHLDHYKDFHALERAFEEFVEKIPFYGLAVFCVDHPVVRALARRFRKRSLTYGLGENGRARRSEADVVATAIRLKGLESRFRVTFRGEGLGEVSLRGMPGRHNVQNSLAAVAVAKELGIPFGALKKAFSGFKGVGRRFEVLHDGSVTVVDDYGHHPEEIRRTLETARRLWRRRRIQVLFQPHRYTRTKLLLNDFATAFGAADRVMVTEIYPAGEEPIRGVSGQVLAAALSARRRRVTYCPEKEGLVRHVMKDLKKGDVIITLGAGDIWKVGKEFAQNIDESFKRRNEIRT